MTTQNIINTESALKIIDIDSNHLKSALLVAAKKDLRYYLCGVFFEKGKIVATDGHRMIVINHDNTDILPIIIKREIIDMLVKQKTSFIQLYIDTAGKVVSVGAGNFKINEGFDCDGKFPEWRRVLPKIEESRAGTCLVNGDYLQSVEKMCGYYSLKGPTSYYMNVDRLSVLVKKNVLYTIMPVGSEIMTVRDMEIFR